MKIAATLEYSGARYSGWQRQHHAESVQQHVEQALSEVADENIKVQCAGRTDAGVHALHQVIHFETNARRPRQAWVLGANTLLPDDISLQWADITEDDFHARFSASSRSYCYVIQNRTTRPALARDLITWEYRHLDASLMQTAANLLIGEHDFSAFRAAGCQAKSAIRDLQDLRVTRHGEYVIINVSANAFLQHMVRNIAGVLVSIGSKENEPGWAGEILASRDRTLGGVTAPASGLYFVKVVYPERFNIPGPATGAWPINF